MILLTTLGETLIQNGILMVFSPSLVRRYKGGTWVGEHLIEYANQEEAKQLHPYMMQEIDDMLDEAEEAFETGDYLTQNEVFHRNRENV